MVFGVTCAPKQADWLKINISDAEDKDLITY